MTEYQKRWVADDGTNGKFLRVDSNRYLLVNVMGGIYTPQTEFHTGADCSGNDGDTNRVLTLQNLSESREELVVVDKMVLEKDQDYTVSHKSSSSTITFLGKIWDNQRIVVRYFI